MFARYCKTAAAVVVAIVSLPVSIPAFLVKAITERQRRKETEHVAAMIVNGICEEQERQRRGKQEFESYFRAALTRSSENRDPLH